MTIRYKTGFAVMLLVCGALGLVTSLLVGRFVPLFIGSMLLIVGIGSLVRPLAKLSETELTMLAMFGPVQRQYPTEQLSLKDGRIYAGDKKVPLPPGLANSADWHALTHWIQSRSGSSRELGSLS